MSAREQLKEEIISKAVVHGKVILSSGKEADYYVDLRRVTLDSVAAPLVGQVMLDLTKDLDYEAVGGLTLGADPVATAMMHVAAQQGRKIDSFVVRKAEKAHGLQRRIEGPDVVGKRVLAVEDTSTTGGSVLTAVEALALPRKSPHRFPVRAALHESASPTHPHPADICPDASGQHPRHADCGIRQAASASPTRCTHRHWGRQPWHHKPPRNHRGRD